MYNLRSSGLKVEEISYKSRFFTTHKKRKRKRNLFAKNSFRNVRAFQIELEFGNVSFSERGKLEYPEKNLSEQSRELATKATNSTHI